MISVGSVKEKTMKIVSFSEANKDFKSVLDVVNNNEGVITIKRSNADDAVVMSLKRYDSLMETLYLLNSPANAAHLATSIAQYENKK